MRCRYRAGLKPTAYPDYRHLRRAALPLLEVRPEQLPNEHGEVLKEGLARELYRSFFLAGIVCQQHLHPDPNPKLREPGFHSSIVTIGRGSPVGFAEMTGPQ